MDQNPLEDVPLDQPASEVPTPEASDPSWESLASNDFEEELPESAPEPAQAAAEVSPPPAAEATPPADPAPAVTSPATTAVEPQPAAPAQAPAASVATTPTAPVSPAALAKFQEALEAKYAIAPEMMADLLVSPEKVLPKLLAQAHLNATRDTLAMVQHNMPHMFEQVSAQRTNTQKAVDAFYAEWPELNKPEYQKTVADAVTSYRNMNKTATAEQVIKAGGALACLTLGIPVPERVLGVNTQQQAPAPVVASPRQPAAPGGAAKPLAQQQTNAFVLLAEELLSDDS